MINEEPAKPCEHDRGDHWRDGSTVDDLYPKSRKDEECPICLQPVAGPIKEPEDEAAEINIRVKFFGGRKFVAYEDWEKEREGRLEAEKELALARRWRKSRSNGDLDGMAMMFELNKRAEAAERRVASLEAALERYSEHEPGCPLEPFKGGIWPDNRKPGKCNCGLENALRGGDAK